MIIFNMKSRFPVLLLLREKVVDFNTLLQREIHSLWPPLQSSTENWGKEEIALKHGQLRCREVLLADQVLAPLLSCPGERITFTLGSPCQKPYKLCL